MDEWGILKSTLRHKPSGTVTTINVTEMMRIFTRAMPNSSNPSINNVNHMKNTAKNPKKRGEENPTCGVSHFTPSQFTREVPDTKLHPDEQEVLSREAYSKVVLAHHIMVLLVKNQHPMEEDLTSTV